MAVEHGPDFIGQPHHEFTILTASFLPSCRGRALPSVQGGFRVAKVGAEGAEVFVRGREFLNRPPPVWKPGNGGKQALIHVHNHAR
jgi:hypothetical protein